MDYIVWNPITKQYDDLRLVKKPKKQRSRKNHRLLRRNRKWSRKGYLEEIENFDMPIRRKNNG